MKKSLHTFKIFLLLFVSGCFIANAQEQQLTVADEIATMMEIWQKNTIPVEEHKALEYFAGEWNVDIKIWYELDKPPFTSSGASSNSLILGGRYLLQKFNGSYANTFFDGMNITGYDTLKKVYRTFCIDSLGTSFNLMEGACEKSGKICSYTGDWNDYIEKKKMKVKEIITIIDQNKYVSEIYQISEAGEEIKTMEIIYTRKNEQD
ncbi:MAG: hypothetical protein A2Y62_04610 [Candidatus Fischerbacteria bacterium RBG_13_37_8]|uniref:DUF1579 domain-containing protein n=1 Tax=Candidatus Fischerbacteria bacterium RBG_13_37_8 TaxID=1817863 RepID=A0A1F5VNT7_9BACT|nr:MAG: hypothetical protein A2Y62_04610 [Candidatus Fischerbacteria bacterium RBG_13_37_8]